MLRLPLKLPPVLRVGLTHRHSPHDAPNPDAFCWCSATSLPMQRTEREWMLEAALASAAIGS